MNAAIRDPSRYLVGGDPPAVVVPARVARFLDRAALDRLRRETRGADGEVDAVLAALHTAGLHWVDREATAAHGRTPLPQVEEVRPSVCDLLDTTAVANALGCKPRNIRDLHQRGRLAGERIAGRLLFAPEVVAEFRADRAS